jgi:hypothetical protein
LFPEKLGPLSFNDQPLLSTFFGLRIHRPPSLRAVDALEGSTRRQAPQTAKFSAVLVRDFGQGGGDPGEKCFTLTRKEVGGTMAAICWGKGDSGLEFL